MNKNDRKQLNEFNKKIDKLNSDIDKRFNELKEEFKDMKRDSLAQTVYTLIGVSITYFAIAITLWLIPEKPFALEVLTLASIAVGTFFTTHATLIYLDNKELLKEKKSKKQMNKHLIVLGIAVLLICVGLSGCQTEEKALTVDELLDNKLKYDNKEVKVEGYIHKYEGISPLLACFYWEYKLYDVSGKRYITLDTIYLDINITPLEEFKIYGGVDDNDYVVVTGIFQAGDGDRGYMDVSNIKKVD